jgi:signal transduction histidine kinase
MASQKGINISIEISNEVSEWILGDPIRLGQVFINLISNSIKFSPHHTNILVKAETLASNDGILRLKFMVKDEGRGIPKVKLKYIFEKFAQVDDATHYSELASGTGLGLSICRHLVDLMGGVIWAESEINKGSTFSFTMKTKAVSEKINQTNEKKAKTQVY